MDKGSCHGRGGHEAEGGAREFIVGLKNWRQLTNRKGRIRCHAASEGLAEANDIGADVILSTELGIALNTGRMEDGRYELDSEKSRKARPGEGVGAFFEERWQGKWIQVEGRSSLQNARIYLLEEGGCQILLGIFYAPQAGRGVAVRMRFYEGLRRVWREAVEKHPRAWRVLAGDANLPGLFTEKGRAGKVENFFREVFERDMHMRVANERGGKPEPTHDKGGTLDIILVGEGVTVEAFGVGMEGVAASDHRLVWARLGFPGHHGPERQPRW